MAKKIKNHSRKLLVLFLVLSLSGVFTYYKYTQAAALTTLSDTISRLKTSEPSNHDIRFRTPTGTSAENIVIKLGTEGTFTGGASMGVEDIDFQYGSSQAEVNDDCTSGCTQASLVLGSGGVGTWGASWSSTDLTLDYPSSGGTAISANDYVRVLIGTNATNGGAGNTQLSNPASTGNKTFSIEIGNVTDSAKIAVAIVSNEQVSMSANVDPSITFTLSANSSAFGTLSTSAIDIADTNITLTVGTNAQSGYTVTAQDSGSGTNPGLYNSNASALIGSTDSSFSNGPTDLTPGTEGYGICAYGSSGSPTIAARYTSGGAGCASDDWVGGLEITATTIFSRATSMTANDAAIVVHKAAIANWTAAGSYTDTITYIATGNF